MARVAYFDRDPHVRRASGRMEQLSRKNLVGKPAAPGKPNPGGGDVNLHGNLSFNGMEFFINGAPFVPPSIPVLLQIPSNNLMAQSLLPPGSVYTLSLNSVIEVSIPGGPVNEEHPFHSHGHASSVVRSAGTAQYNYVNPVKRDTVNIGLAGDNVTIRFVTDNPGRCFLHCHIDFHLVAGLAIVFAEDAPDVAHVNPVPEALKELCPKYDATLNHKRMGEL